MAKNCSAAAFIVMVAGALCALSAGIDDEPQESRNALYVEFLGNGGLYSLNYDRTLFTIAERHRFGFRVGFSLATVDVDTINAKFPMVFPLTINYSLGRQRRLELGGGVSPRVYFRNSGDPVFSVEPCATLGFKLQRLDNDFIFRIGFTPLFFDGFLPWGGISMGRAF